MDDLIKKYNEQLEQQRKLLDEYQNELDNETYNDYGEVNESIGYYTGQIELLSEIIKDLEN